MGEIALYLLLVWSTTHRLLPMKVTAYCPCEKCCGQWASIGHDVQGHRITACGHVIATKNVFIAAPRIFAYHTKMIVPGYNNSLPVEVLDRGGAIKGNRIDVYFPTHEEALQWGVRYLWVDVIIQ